MCFLDGLKETFRCALQEFGRDLQAIDSDRVTIGFGLNHRRLIDFVYKPKFQSVFSSELGFFVHQGLDDVDGFSGLFRIDIEHVFLELFDVFDRFL